MAGVLPGGAVVRASDGQRIPFSAPTSGEVLVRAILRATANASATVFPGTQIIHGIVEAEAD